jgi:membrane-bound transcription factor site-1 protease
MHAVLGLTQHKGGRVAVYGDSNCLDSSHMRYPCFRLLSKLIQYVTTVRCFTPHLEPSSTPHAVGLC